MFQTLASSGLEIQLPFVTFSCIDAARVPASMLLYDRIMLDLCRHGRMKVEGCKLGFIDPKACFAACLMVCNATSLLALDYWLSLDGLPTYFMPSNLIASN